MDIFDYVLHHNPNLKNVSDHHRRREILLNDLFLIVYKRTSRALLHRDHVMLAVLLAQVKLRGMEEISDGLEFLLESGQGVAVSTTPSTEHPTPSILTPDQMMHLESYAKQSLFKPVLSNILEHPDDWIPFLQSSNPESIVPTPWEPNTPVVEALRSMLIVKCLRPDRLLQSTALFVRNVFQSDLSSDLDLGAMVANEVPAATPLALVSVTGYDASYRVENLIQSTGARSSSVAMGSQEGFTLADQAIAAASRQGTWVLLKNVHLAPTWLGQLEKKLQTLNPQDRKSVV